MMDSVKKALESLNLQKLLWFFASYADCLHISRYHREGYPTHCLLVIYWMIQEFQKGKVSGAALVAACLHDIAKPRTAALNKRKEACFYGHENVTDEELANFLSPSYPEFQKVALLIRAHMLPLGVREATPEPFRSKNQERLDAILAREDKVFESDLRTLSTIDQLASVKNDADLKEAERLAEETRAMLLNLCNGSGEP